MISVIIPFYNEEIILAKNSEFFNFLSHKTDLIFVDSGSEDRSVELARGFGRVLLSKKGRAAQMNYGASFAQGDILFFLHADTFISQDALVSIEGTLLNADFIGGCLTQKIDKEGIAYRLIEKQGNLRARMTKIFYGDQGIFVKKDIFLKIGGFPDAPIMEDVLFSKNLRKLGRTVVLSDKIFVSSRRWDRNGVIKTIMLYNLLIILFNLRFPLNRIKKLYDDLR